jgi:hypothetical protein
VINKIATYFFNVYLSTGPEAFGEVSIERELSDTVRPLRLLKRASICAIKADRYS